MSDKTFIVPHDFTELADNAMRNAIVTAKFVKAKIYALHVVAKEKHLEDARKELAKQLEKFAAEDVEIIPSVRVGNIFDDIGEFAAEHDAELIFMGTHGASGVQKITGSHALKVVSYSSVPFVVTQLKPVKDSGYDDIVVPLDLHKETKQKLAIVASMARYFKSRVHVITPDETDEFLKHKVQANIQFAKKFFSERDIEITATLAPSSGFDKEIVKHAIHVDADLIAIMNIHKNSIFGAFSNNYEQYMITNDAQIPVLVVNPVDSSQYGGSVLFT
ncbi:Nucleotide-binding universal stress protein, UspA family [Lishizhenia tianjinensis]|uniref:Nucleotide-binding universal stress protein, UspA family n=1 Tax=Lishizhenia tianjinensis TaxID=477690 RepID=A0A1I7BBS8_9FLAO|nr:universal stress protein [Lishizhenia tianjinensis]SFT84594.1 Nucleotide-binding universal stress protein, UspA family [Lishizhenia tianjinensis]